MKQVHPSKAPHSNLLPPTRPHLLTLALLPIIPPTMTLCGICIFTMKYYLATNKMKSCYFVKRVDLKDIILSKIRQIDREDDCMFSIICGKEIQSIRKNSDYQVLKDRSRRKDDWIYCVYYKCLYENVTLKLISLYHHELLILNICHK